MANAHPPADHDGDTITWRDIEALPYYVMGVFALAVTIPALADASPGLQSMAVKAAVVVALIGAWQAASGSEA